MKDRALLLSGGAFRGAVQVPVIEELSKRYIYDDVYGVSVGSINGAMFCQDELINLRKIWDDTDNLGGFLKMQWYWPFGGLYSMKPLRKKLEKYISLKKMKTTFHAGTVSATDGEYYNLSTDKMERDEQIWDAIQASSCMAGIMKPGTFVYDDQVHIGIDGGFRSIIPIPIDEYKHVDVVTCTPLDRMKMKDDFNKKSIIPLIMRGIEIFEDEVFDRDLTTLQYSNIKSITVYSPQEYPGESLDASKEAIRYRYKLGEEAFKKPFVLKG